MRHVLASQYDPTALPLRQAIAAEHGLVGEKSLLNRQLISQEMLR
jgi:hypothetical protein